MNKITVTECEEIIYGLGREVVEERKNYKKTVVHMDVTLCDILKTITEEAVPFSEEANDIFEKWEECGVNKSLQQILKEAEKKWETGSYEESPIKIEMHSGYKFGVKSEIVTGAAAELFLFLKEIKNG